MADEFRNRRPADPERVSVAEAWEVRYWCKQFGCTERQLREAVSTVGDAGAKVRVYLKNKSKPRIHGKMG
jgi:hypothetical protein